MYCKMKRVIILFLPLMLLSCRVQQPISSERFAQDVQSDMPFKVSSMSAVPNYADVYAFQCDGPIDLLPDYEVDAEGTSMIYRTTFAPTHEKQPANVIWRNLVINRKAKRVLCVDRLVRDGKTFGYVYVLQSETKDYSDEHTYHWDVSDQRLLINVAGAIEHMSHLSVSRLELNSN